MINDMDLDSFIKKLNSICEEIGIEEPADQELEIEETADQEPEIEATNEEINIEQAIQDIDIFIKQIDDPMHEQISKLGFECYIAIIKHYCNKYDYNNVKKKVIKGNFFDNKDLDVKYKLIIYILIKYKSIRQIQTIVAEILLKDETLRANIAIWGNRTLMLVENSDIAELILRCYKENCYPIPLQNFNNNRINSQIVIASLHKMNKEFRNIASKVDVFFKEKLNFPKEISILIFMYAQQLKVKKKALMPNIKKKTLVGTKEKMVFWEPNVDSNLFTKNSGNSGKFAKEHCLLM